MWAVRGAKYDKFGGPDCIYVLYGRTVLICTMHEALHRAWKFQLVKGAFNNYVDKMRGRGSKTSVFVHAQGIKTVHAGGKGVKNGKILST